MQNEFDYRKYLLLLNKHKRLFAIVSLIIMTGVVVASYVLPKKYVAQSVVYVSRGVLNDLVRGIAVTPTVEETLRGLESAIKSRALLAKVSNDLDLNLSKRDNTRLDSIIERLRNNTDIKLNDKEGLITITVLDRDPMIARDYINALVRRYIEDNLSNKREESYGATSFLSEQIASIKEKVDKVDAEIGKVRREKGIALTNDAGGVQSDINVAQQRLDELALRRSQLEITRNQLRSNNPARTRLVALQRRLEELRVEYTDNYPEVVKVKADIEAAQREVGKSTPQSMLSEPHELARIEAELNAVRVSEARQRTLISSNRGMVRENPVARSELDKLEQERNNYRTLYDQLMARKNQAEVSKQMEVQDKATTFKIIEPAVLPTTPVSPNRIRMILIGIAAGIAGGFGLLMLIDFFDKTVKNVNELKPLGIKIIAVIPTITDPGVIEVEQQKDFKLYVVAGAYLSLIIILLGLESLGLSPVDKIISLFK